MMETSGLRCARRRQPWQKLCVRVCVCVGGLSVMIGGIFHTARRSLRLRQIPRFFGCNRIIGSTLLLGDFSGSFFSFRGVVVWFVLRRCFTGTCGTRPLPPLRQVERLVPAGDTGVRCRHESRQKAEASSGQRTQMRPRDWLVVTAFFFFPLNQHFFLTWFNIFLFNSIVFFFF